MRNWKTVLQNLDIKNTIYKFDKWWCGCDYLRLCYRHQSDYIEDKILLFDCDNSNFWTQDLWDFTFTIQKIYCTLWIALTYSVSYNDIVVPCFQFVKYNENSRFLFNSYWKLDIYWSMFRLIDMWFFNKSIFLLIKAMISDEDPKITRFDYRLDFFSMKNLNVPDVQSFVKYKHTQSKIIEYKTWWEINDWFIGSKKNWRYAIRYYDKLLDTDKKQKVFLYQDYFIYNTVHRLEFEFQSNFLKWYTFYDFYDWNIESRICDILWLGEKMFWGPLFYQYEEDYIIQDKDKSKYLRKYSTSSVRLAKNWINPLIQCYKSLFYDLEEEELNKNVSDFLTFIWQDKNLYKLRYDLLKKEFLDLHKIN